MVCASVVFAQDYTFKVLASKGVAQVDNGSGWTLLKSGSKLDKKSKVKISQGSYVGLMHTSGKTLELKTPGTYEVENLSGKLNNSQSSFTSKYASFVLNQSSGETAAQNYNVTGSVSRGTIPEGVKILAPQYIKMYKNIPATIAWESNEEAGFVVSVVTLFNETIVSLETDNKFIDLNLKELKLDKDTYVLRVALKSDPNKVEEKALKIIDPSKESAVLDGVTKLSSELSEESPLDQLTYASYFEEQGLTTYALSSLSKAYNLAPDVEDFETLRTQYYFSKAMEK